MLRRLAERGGRLKDYDDMKGVDPETLGIMFAELPLRYHVDNDDGEGLARRLREDPGSARGIFPQTIGDRPLMDLCLQGRSRPAAGPVTRRGEAAGEDESLKDYSEQALALSDLSRPDWMGITQLHDIAAFGTVRRPSASSPTARPWRSSTRSTPARPWAGPRREGRTEMAAFLLEKGADPQGTGPSRGPRPCGRKRGHEETAAVSSGGPRR